MPDSSLWRARSNTPCVFLSTVPRTIRSPIEAIGPVNVRSVVQRAVVIPSASASWVEKVASRPLPSPLPWTRAGICLGPARSAYSPFTRNGPRTNATSVVTVPEKWVESATPRVRGSSMQSSSRWASVKKA